MYQYGAVVPLLIVATPAFLLVASAQWRGLPAAIGAIGRVLGFAIFHLSVYLLAMEGAF